MKRLPLILSALFLAITLARVASFAQHELKAGALGWIFSIALGVAVYASAYWTRIPTTRKQAIAALVLFILIDAFFNFAHVWLSADTQQPLVAGGAVLYGLFPTLAVALLGWLSGAISRLPPGVGERGRNRLEQALYSRIVQWAERAEQTEQAKDVVYVLPEQAAYKYNCSFCDWGTDDAKSYAGHMSSHARKNGHKSIQDNRQEPSIIGNNGHKEAR
jgi:4-amino-4-deoxy-L-arabinose transferase-like glycosyltransferase